MQTRLLQVSGLLDIEIFLKTVDEPFNDSKLTNSILNPYPILIC